MRGPDAEGLTHDQRRPLVHQFEAALRLLDERCRVYQYVIKQTVEPFVAPSVRSDRRTGGPSPPSGVSERSPPRALSRRPLPRLLYEALVTAGRDVSARQPGDLAAARTARLALQQPHVPRSSRANCERAVDTLHSQGHGRRGAARGRAVSQRLAKAGGVPVLPTAASTTTRRRSPPRR